jgi:hypothetical protein
MSDAEMLEQVDPGASYTDPAAYPAPEMVGEPPQMGEPEEETPDYAALLEAERQRATMAEESARAIAQQAEYLQQQQQQQAYAQAQQAWKQKTEQVWRETESWDPEQRDAALRAYYEQQIAEVANAGQTAIAMVMAQGWSDRVMQQYGLEEKDRMLLGNNPNQMPIIAARIAEERQNHKQVLERMDKERRALEAQRIMGNGVNRIGGRQGGAAQANEKYEKGSIDHLKALYFGE